MLAMRSQTLRVLLLATGVTQVVLLASVVALHFGVSGSPPLTWVIADLFSEPSIRAIAIAVTCFTFPVSIYLTTTTRSAPSLFFCLTAALSPVLGLVDQMYRIVVSYRDYGRQLPLEYASPHIQIALTLIAVASLSVLMVYINAARIRHSA